MFNGVDPFVMLGASGNPDAPGLEFRYDEDDRWPYPNPTGLEAVMEGYCPPHYRKPPPKFCNSQLGAVIFMISSPHLIQIPHKSEYFKFKTNRF